MALITTAAAGNWSNTATWVGGVLPAATDDIQIDHALTVDGTYTCTHINQATSGPLLTIPDTRELIFRGYFNPRNSGGKKVVVQMDAGSTLTFDAANQVGANAGRIFGLDSFTHGVFACDGTLAKPVIIRQTGSGTRRMSIDFNDDLNRAGSIWPRFTYVNFVGVGGPTFYALYQAIGYGGAGNAEVILDNCIFDAACGRIRLFTAISAGSSTGGTVRLLNTVHKGGDGTHSLRIEGDAVGATVAEIDGGFYEQRLECVDPAGWTFKNGVVMWGGMGSTAPNKPAPPLFENVFRRSIENDQQYIIANESRTYDLVDIPGVSGNPHPLYAPYGFDSTRTDCVFDAPDATYLDGDFVSLGLPSVSRVHTEVRTLMLPTSINRSPGKIVSGLGNANSNMALLHCTYVSDDTPGTNSEVGLGIGETYVGHAGMVQSFKSNLAYSFNAGTAVLVAGANHAGKTQDSLPPANATHNATMNGKTGTTSGVTGFHDYQVTTPFWSAAPNANGVYLTGTPQFVDATRDSYKWAVTRGAAESLAGLKSVLLNAFDWLSGGFDASAANKTPALLDWVRAGFVVTDAALNNAGHDGATIGAMSYLALSLPTIGASPPPTITHGLAFNLPIVNADAGDRTVTITQGAVTLSLTETGGTNSNVIVANAVLERADPLTSLRRVYDTYPTNATIRVTRTSDSEFVDYDIRVIDPANQTHCNPIATGGVLASVPPWIVGDQLQARGVSGGALPAGFTIYGDGNVGASASGNFEYRVYDSVTNTVGSWALATVSIGNAPAITVQPSSQAVADGAAFSFSIVATGDAPLAYQWTDDGANVGTDSPTYAGTASLAMNGSTIRVTVSNAYGSVLSSAVTLTVTGVISPPGPITGLAVTAITATGATVSYNSTPTATSYEYTLDGTNWVNVGLVLSFPLSGLTQFTNYSVAVRAVNSGGTGAQSSAPFKTLDAQPPTSPQDLMETTIGATTATFSFTAATDNAAVTGYRYRVDGGTYVNIGVSFSFSVSGLSAGSAHLVEVVAYDAAGNVSFPAARSFTTSTLSAPITNVDDIRFHVRGLFKRFVNEGESLAVRVYCRAGKYPATPTQIRYRISCANTDECLQDWQTTTPASVVDVLIPAELNRLRSQWHWFEQRALTVEATNADGSVRISEYRYFVQNVIGVD